MGQNTSVCLGNYFDNFVKVTISEGRYSNVNEIVCEGLRLLEEENKIKTLKKLLQEGLDSGIAENFNPKKHLEFLKKYFCIKNTDKKQNIRIVIDKNIS